MEELEIEPGTQRGADVASDSLAAVPNVLLDIHKSLLLFERAAGRKERKVDFQSVCSLPQNVHNSQFVAMPKL